MLGRLGSLPGFTSFWRPSFRFNRSTGGHSWVISIDGGGYKSRDDALENLFQKPIFPNWDYLNFYKVENPVKKNVVQNSKMLQ
jgi:hypothetical protein